jgi:hypothetical protein
MLWMGGWAWMGFVGGMALKHSSQNFPCFGGWYVSGLELPGIKTHAKPPIET